LAHSDECLFGLCIHPYSLLSGHPLANVSTEDFCESLTTFDHKKSLFRMIKAEFSEVNFSQLRIYL
jgi:hypothetical protein